MSLFQGRAAVVEPERKSPVCPGCHSTVDLTDLRIEPDTYVKACRDPRGCCNRARAQGMWCK